MELAPPQPQRKSKLSYKEGRELAKIHKNVVVKVPIIKEGLKAVKELTAEGIKTNVTVCFSPLQAMLAAKVSWLLRGLTRREHGARAPVWTGEWYSLATCQPSDTAAQTRALPDAGRTGPAMHRPVCASFFGPAARAV